MSLSKASIQESIKKIQRISDRLPKNIILATKDLMDASYDLLVEYYKKENLSNHISTLNKEIISDGYGFRLWTNDWIVIFNEYGTGVVGEGTHPDPKDYKYNIKTQYKDSTGKWVYFNDDLDSFITTRGMRAKHMFYDLEEQIKLYASKFYETAIECSLNDEQYQSFRESLR